MLNKCRNHCALLLTSLIFANSAGFAQAQVGLHENTTVLPPKLFETLQSSGVATLSLGPTWENAGSTQMFYLAPNIEKAYAANHASHALVDGEIFLGIQKINS